jgi:PAS domain S-box-containing protein
VGAADSEGRRTADVEALLSAAPDAMLVADAHGLIVRANARCERLLGYEPGELAGRPVEALAPADLPEMRRRYLAYVNDPAGPGMGSAMLLDAYDKRGALLTVEITLSPFDTAEGPVILASIRKVSQSRHDEGLFRRFLEAAPDAVVIVDETGQIILVNAQAEEMFGYARAELLGRSVEVLVPERFGSMHSTFRAGYVGAPRPRPIGVAGGLFGLRQDGTEFPVEIALSPLETDEGVLVLADVRDITERLAVTAAMREAEERQRIQEETNRAKTEFFATVSHELRTPLASMIGFAELIDDVEDLSPQCRHFLSVILRNGRREQRLVDDLLTVVNISEHGLTMHASKVDLARVVEEAVDSARPQADEAGIAIRKELPDSPVRAWCDSERIGQAIDSLLSNALKFTPPGGDVVVRLFGVNGTARIEVADSGMGIEDADHDRVFERLYRSQAAVAREIPGAGLGLSIASAILEAHHGNIRVKSSSEAGSTFEMEIPVAAPVRTAAQNSRSVGSSSPRSAS